MRNRYHVLLLWTLAVIVPSLASVRADAAALAQALIDRKFPNFSFCPIESRGSSLVHFIAPANGSVRVTFSADNFFPQFQGGDLVYNEPRIDNVMLMPRTQWEGNHTSCSEGCFTENGQFDPAPTFPSDAASIAGLPYVELFDSSPFAVASPAWAGGSWDTGHTAPKNDATGTDCGFAQTGGSLLLGTEAQGDIAVSSTLTVSGLTPGVEYVVAGWMFVRSTVNCSGAPCWAQLSIIVDENGAVGSESSTWGAVKAVYGTQE